MNFTTFFFSTAEDFLKQEIEADISAEYDEEDKPYQTEGDGEIATYESGSQENGNSLSHKISN